MAPQRDGKGRFIKGKSGNPKGRPPKATEAEYLDALKDILPVDRFQRIVDQYAKRAERGDTRAAEVLFKYVLPNVQKNEHTGKDGAPFAVQIEYVNTPYPAAWLSSGASRDNAETEEV